MILVVVVLAFTSAIGAIDLSAHPPCVFNPLCTCSRSDSNLGDVTCQGVPLAKLPSYLNRSKINSLRLSNNGLKKIDSHFLSGTGLHMLKISGNSLYDVEIDALNGLENSLRDLELSYTELIRVPSPAFNGLQRLQILNLSGNDIVDVSRENWLHVGNTLEVLILRDNAIKYVPAGAFEKLIKLKILDLSANTLIEIDADAFLSDSASSLTHLYLADNQLRYIPYVQLRTSRALKTLDLDYNFIDNVDAVPDSLAGISIDSKLLLQSLRLRYNTIRSLSASHFRRFSIIDSVDLAGNPISNIQFGTFEQMRVRYLSLANCDLSKLDVRMLRGLEEILVSLDLSGNNLGSLDSNLFSRFIALRELKTLGNSFNAFSIPDSNSGGNLLRLEVGGGADLDGQILLRDISRIKSLISITISNVEIPFTAPHQFVGYGFGVEELSISKARMKSIHARAFIHVRGLKLLDLSNNELHEIDENAFTEIGHSLNTLRLSHAFANDVKIVPHLPMKRLISLKLLDISFNSFEELPFTSFHSMYNLESVRIHDCQIKDLKLGTFQSDVHIHLKEITFSYNQLSIMKSFTFTDLPELRYLNLEENSLRTIETRAFNNLNKLRWLYLRGNRLETIELEAFSNLPELELVDLAFNNLKKFELIALDEMVGSSTFLNLNLSFNEIRQLSTNYMDNESEVPSLNIKTLDLSGNQIMDICKDYFVPIENTLTNLYLSRNRLTNTSRAVFGSLSQLQWLDLSFNKINRVDPDTMRETDEIQILNLRSNNLYDLPPNLFHGMKNLRLIDLSDNKLNFLSEYSFREDSLEVVWLAQNRFVRIPFKSFSSMVAASLRELDLSFNSIDSLYSPEFRSAAIFKSLTHMNVSSNKISRLDSQILIELPYLLSLDLSHNRPLQFVEQHPTFDRFEENLRCLSLRNTSLTYVPHLPFQKLTVLLLADNNLTNILPEAVANLTSVRVLDLSRNNFTSIPVAILSMKNLKHLNLSSNYIRTLVNNSILGGLEELRELDISYLPLRVFETGALGRLTSLRTLHASTYSEIHNFKFSKILAKNRCLRSLHIHVSGKTLDEEMEGHFSKSVREIFVYGSQLERVSDHILSGFSSPQFSLTLFGTNLESLPNDVFRNADLRLKNITVDVRNNALKYLSNPSTGLSPGSFGQTFLVSLKISRNLWTCRCDIGWVETWSRVRRQIFCRHSDLASDKSHHECLQVSDDLRMTRCDAGKSLLETMHFDLECQWSGRPILQVNAVLKESAFLPCDISPVKGDDSATLVLWYKNTVENPVYSFDKRKGILESKSHWQDDVIFKGRAYFTIMSMPTGLALQNVEEKDAGYYRCRVDFNHSPTKNQKLHLNVIGKN
ncbi:hypothetical protein V9T40_001820 [Parthenolecanium corni]|uniref:Ig-like domain-containing protein n=1 Tax=Parthenolecanium corni TaxID=536013 RepID=A0AAN9Y3U0_9HEMI